MRNYLIISILLSSFTFGQTPNSWEKKGDFPGLKRSRAVGIALDTLGYLGTGIDTAEIMYSDWWAYDPGTDSWTQKMDVPGPARRNAVAFVIDNKGYVGTGIDHPESDLGTKLFDLHEYDPISNSWTTKADYPDGLGSGFCVQSTQQGVYQAAAFAIDGKGYVACGKIGCDDYLPDLWEYDPVADDWTAKPPFPGGDRHQLSAFAVEGKGYVGMGTDHDIYRKDWWAYDPVTSSWTVAADLPGVSRSGASTFVIESRAYVVFGTDGGFLDELWEYNPFTNSWNVKSAFGGSARKNGVAFAVDGVGFAGLGKGISGKKQSWYKYFPAGPLSVDELNTIGISIYPNPVTSESRITFSEFIQNSWIKIHGINGQLILEKQITSASEILGIDARAGEYIVSVVNASGELIGTSKVIVQ